MENKLLQQFESTDMVLLGTSHMIGHQSMDVSTVMAEFYKVFRADNEGPSLTMLPTTMLMRILVTTFKFVKDTFDAATNQNAGQTTPSDIPTGSFGLPDTAYDYRSITRRRGRP